MDCLFITYRSTIYRSIDRDKQEKKEAESIKLRTGDKPGALRLFLKIEEKLTDTDESYYKGLCLHTVLIPWTDITFSMTSSFSRDPL